MALAERFEGLYQPEPNTGCWLWVGTMDQTNGYGRFRWNGRSQNAHRIVKNASALAKQHIKNGGKILAKKIGTRPTPSKPAKGMTQRPNVNIQRSCGADYSRESMRATRATNGQTEAYKSTRR